MIRSRRFSAGAVLVDAAALGLTGCSGGGAPQTTGGNGGGGGAGDNSGYTVAMITHAPPGDTFWDKIQQGGTQARRTTA